MRFRMSVSRMMYIIAVVALVFTLCRHVSVRMGDRPGVWVWWSSTGDPYENPLNLVCAIYKKPIDGWTVVKRREGDVHFSHASYLPPDGQSSVWWFRDEEREDGIHVAECPYMQ